jgi:hypothetical protein
MSIIENFKTFTKLYAPDSIFNGITSQHGGQESETQEEATTEQMSDQKTEFQRRLEDISNKATYSGASANLIFNLLKLVYEYVILYSLKIINFFYQRLESELKSFAGDADSINGEIDENRRLLKAIEIVIQSPEFQQKWNEFTTILAELIGSMVDKIRQELDGEFGEMINDITDLVYKNTKTAAFGIGLGVLDGVCALPPMIPICELMIVAGTGTKLTSETFLTFMRSVTRIANSFSKVFGDTSDKFANVIKQSLDMYTTITDLISNASNIGVSAINEASNKVASLTPSTQQITLKGGKSKTQTQTQKRSRKHHQQYRSKSHKKRKQCNKK